MRTYASKCMYIRTLKDGAGRRGKTSFELLGSSNEMTYMPNQHHEMY
jgi:hypothetical protein